MKAILAAAAIALSPPSGPAEYQKAWCDGYNTAFDAMMKNRDHYRSLLGRPTMSHDEVLAWIYSRPWKDDGPHRTAPRRLDQPPGVPEVGPHAAESVDLYLLLPTKCAVPG